MNKKDDNAMVAHVGEDTYKITYSEWDWIRKSIDSQIESNKLLTKAFLEFQKQKRQDFIGKMISLATRVAGLVTLLYVLYWMDLHDVMSILIE